MNTRNQNWGDDLRLPTFVDPLPIVSVLDSLRRISHPFQNKHLPVLKRGSWFALKRPADRSRTGLLCLVPEKQQAIYIGNDRGRTNSRVALLRLRVDPQFYAAGTGMTVFAATLCPAARELLVEDVLLWKGDDVANELTFTERCVLLIQWLDHYCEADARLIGGLTVKAANWQPIDAVTPDGVWEFQQDEEGRRRLMWINPGRGSAPANVSHVAVSAPVSPTVEVATAPVPIINVGALVAIATKEAGPDQWALRSADGVSLGRALVRTLDVSSAMRSQGNTVSVTVEWNATFGKWGVRAVTTEPASPSAFFTEHK